MRSDVTTFSGSALSRSFKSDFASSSRERPFSFFAAIEAERSSMMTRLFCVPVPPPSRNGRASANAASASTSSDSDSDRIRFKRRSHADS